MWYVPPPFTCSTLTAVMCTLNGKSSSECLWAKDCPTSNSTSNSSEIVRRFMLRGLQCQATIALSRRVWSQPLSSYVGLRDRARTEQRPEEPPWSGQQGCNQRTPAFHSSCRDAE